MCGGDKTKASTRSILYFYKVNFFLTDAQKAKLSFQNYNFHIDNLLSQPASAKLDYSFEELCF